jgi:CHASE3 domain sensor protein
MRRLGKRMFPRQATITQRIWGLFAVFAMALLVLVGALAWNLHRVTIERQALVRTEAIERNLSALAEVLLDAETGPRGYLLTLDEKYLDPYNAAVTRISSKLDALQKLMVDPETRRDLSLISPLVLAKMKELATTIVLARSGQHDRALQIVNGGLGKRLMDGFRTIGQDMIRRESELMAQRRAHIDANIFTTTMILFIGSGALLCALFAYTRRIAAQLGRPVRALIEGLQTVAAGQGYRPIDVSTSDEIGELATAFNTMAERLTLAQEAVRDAHLRIERSLRATRDGIFEGSDFRVGGGLWVSTQWLEMLGYDSRDTPQTLTAAALNEMTHPNDREFVQQSMMDASRSDPRCAFRPRTDFRTIKAYEDRDAASLLTDFWNIVDAGRRLSMAAKELMFFNKVSNRIPCMLALVQPRESERPVVLHSLADKHAHVSANGYGCVPHAQRVIKQQLVFSDEKQQRR